jgi:hypothetical protein
VDARHKAGHDGQIFRNFYRATTAWLRKTLAGPGQTATKPKM